MIPPRITCLFHSSLSVAKLLISDAGHAFASDLLVECSPAPALGFTLNLETPATYPGLAGLFGGADIGSLANATDPLPAPIILAPGAATAPGVIRAALPLLRKPDARQIHIMLLVPMSVARSFGAELSLADRFTLAWDVSEFPHEELLEFAQWLGRERLLDRANFDGVIAYATEPIDAAHSQRIAALLAPFATAERPAGVLALAS